MVSINSSATLAIRNLQSISKSLSETQDRMTTGFKVRSAKDNATVWAAATNIRSEIKSSESIREKLDGVQAAADVATVGADAIASALSEMKTKLTAYGLESDADKKAVMLVDINSLKKQINTTIGSAEYNGANWLDGSAASISYVASLTNAGVEESTTFTLTDVKTSLSTQTTALVIGDVDTQAEIDALNTAIDTKVTAVKLYSSQISALNSRITSQSSLLQKIADVKESALGNLVNADLEEEVAKASALQIKQQLAYQAISMANASTANILRLFQ